MGSSWNDPAWTWAWHALFGDDSPPPRDPTEVAPERLRCAFRKRALATHPDQSTSLDPTRAEASSDFRRVVAAYECLREAATRTPEPVRVVSPMPPTAPCPRSPAAPFGPTAAALPDRPLALAQLLYHLGWVSWESVSASLRWQREQRPPLGCVASNAGALREADIRRVLLERRADERFGQCALRLGLLSRIDVHHALLEQRRIQPRVGQFFVKTGHVTPDRLREALARQQAHNLRAVESLRRRRAA